MRYGEWFTQMDGSHEHRLPALMMITKNYEVNHDVLFTNTARLVGKYDLHTTLLRLTDPYLDL